MTSFEIRLRPSAKPATTLRLLHARGSRQQTILSFRVGIDASGGRVVNSGGRYLDAAEGALTIERGVKYSTEKGVPHLGFLNDQGAFWGDGLKPEASASFQAYVYLPDDLFDRLNDWARQGSLPEACLQVAASEGWSARAGTNGTQEMAWDNTTSKSSKLETVRFDFSTGDAG